MDPDEAAEAGEKAEEKKTLLSIEPGDCDGFSRCVFRITGAEAGERIDRLISRQNDTGLSRSYLQKLIHDGLLSANGSVIKASYRPHAGEEVVLLLPDTAMPDILPENIPLDILYEDEDVLVLNKPKHMVVHPAPGHVSGTLVNALLYHCQDSLSGINGVMRPGIVHRIDQDTTGSLIVCKNDASHAAIARQLAEHSIVRRYRAIVHGVLPEEEGTIDYPICRHPHDRKKMMAVVPTPSHNRHGQFSSSDITALHAKDAITHYAVLERFLDYTYVECRLETGRTHQIRVHMDAIGHPVLGDPVYGKRKSPYPVEGQTLHAMTLGFVHPRTGEYIETIAPLPEYFEQLLALLRET